MKTEILKLELISEMDIVLAHKRCIQLCELTGMSVQDQTRFATAVSEISRNVLEYAKTGSINLNIVCDDDQYQLETLICDKGPGIEDIGEILNRNHPSSKGRGLGIVYSRKLVDHFSIETGKQGTSVILAKYIPRKHPPINNLIIQGWRKHFENKAPVSPYEEIKKRNMELLEMSEKLQKEKLIVEHQMNEIKRLNLELQKTNDDLKEFAYAVSHDLRSPLTALKLRVEMYDETTGEELKKKNFDAIRKSSSRLEKTIEGLVEIIDLQGKVQKAVKEVNLELMLKHIQSEFAHLLAKKNVTINQNLETVKITFVEPYIKSILTNVLSNSIKYSSDERPLVVDISVVKEGGFTVLSITDNGIGIDLEKTGGNLFKPFSRFNKSAEGRGIGLYIIRSMVEKNGGKVTVNSTIGEGTTFSFYLKEYSLSNINQSN